MKKKDNTFNLWEYTYYRVTILYSKAEKSAGFKANMDTGASVVTTCIFFNLESMMFLILPLIFGNDLIELIDNFFFICFHILLYIIILLLSLYILEKKRHKIIFKQYSEDTLRQRKFRGWVVITYIVFSIIIIGISISIGKDILNV
jgi:hypothetical protein